MNLTLDYNDFTLWPINFCGWVFLFRFHKSILLSIAAEAIYLHEGCKSKVIIDYLCPFNDLIRYGSSKLLFILLVFKFLLLFSKTNFLQKYRCYI